MTVDRDWILQRLTGKRGEKTRLAEALGLGTTNFSKILSGQRRMTPKEVEAAKAFFGVVDPVTDEEAALLALFRSVPPAKRLVALEVVQALAAQADEREASVVAPKKDDE